MGASNALTVAAQDKQIMPGLAKTHATHCAGEKLCAIEGDSAKKEAHATTSTMQDVAIRARRCLLIRHARMAR
jgi:hypothetical protein